MTAKTDVAVTAWPAIPSVMLRSPAIGVSIPAGRNSAMMRPATPRAIATTAFHAALLVSAVNVLTEYFLALLFAANISSSAYFQKWHNGSRAISWELTVHRNQLDGLLALKLVADKRNFTAAAEELGISPPAISKMIKQLETRLGVALLSRTTRSTRLTEAGERFLAQAGVALDQILAAMTDIGAYASKPTGLLRLNLPLFSYPSFLAPRVASFLRKYPDVSIELFFEETASDVVAEGFDAGVRDSDILARDMVAIKLFGPIRFVIVGAPGYFDRLGRPKHPKDLISHNCLRVRVNDDWIYDKWEFEQKGKAFHVQVKGSLIVNDAIQALNAASDGIGLMYVTEDVAKSRLVSGKLEIVLSHFAPTSDGYYLYYPRRSQVQPKLRAFIDHLKSEKPRN
jgi:DNA-binding transcriptional LysR family regulator